MSFSEAFDASLTWAVGALLAAVVAGHTGLEPLQAGLVVAVAPVVIDTVGNPFA